MDRAEQLKIMNDICVRLRERLKGLIKAGMYVTPQFSEEEDDWIIYVNLYNEGDRSVYTFHNMLDKLRLGNDIVKHMADGVAAEYRIYILKKYFV